MNGERQKLNNKNIFEGTIKNLENEIIKMQSQLDVVQELLKISLVNHLLSDVNIYWEGNDINNNDGITNEIVGELARLGLSIKAQYVMGKYNTVLVQCNGKVYIKTLRYLRKYIEEISPNTIPVFCIEHLTERLRKLLKQEKISYIVEGKEIQILRKENGDV